MEDPGIKLIIARMGCLSRTLEKRIVWQTYARSNDGRMFYLKSYPTPEKAFRLGQKLLNRKLKKPDYYFERFINRNKL